jgi:hypothetical protein
MRLVPGLRHQAAEIGDERRSRPLTSEKVTKWQKWDKITDNEIGKVQDDNET